MVSSIRLIIGRSQVQALYDPPTYLLTLIIRELIIGRSSVQARSGPPFLSNAGLRIMNAVYFSLHSPQELFTRLKEGGRLKKGAAFIGYQSELLPKYKCVWASTKIDPVLIEKLQLVVVFQQSFSSKPSLKLVT